jgi:DNA-binding Lrp family transcriptional regulator
MAELKLDVKDVEILNFLQRDAKVSVKKIARQLRSPMTTVYAKIRRMEEAGIIRGYKAILNASKLGRGTTAFVLASFAYRLPETLGVLSQRDVARKICRFPEVQEVHIVSGNWDILIKVKAKDVDAVGKFVVDRLRTVEGIEKTLTMLVFGTEKETTDIHIKLT